MAKMQILELENDFRKTLPNNFIVINSSKRQIGHLCRGVFYYFPESNLQIRGFCCSFYTRDDGNIYTAQQNVWNVSYYAVTHVTCIRNKSLCIHVQR